MPARCFTFLPPFAFWCTLFSLVRCTPVPSLSPTLDIGLPPQAIATYNPTVFLSTENETTQFRIKAIAIMFSIAGFVFFLILVHFIYNTLSEKDWTTDDNDGVKTNKWEALEDHEERRRFLEDIAAGIRKPDSGVQWDENAFADSNLPTLEPSWKREIDFEMQWENPDQSHCIQDKILTAVPSRWSSNVPDTLNAGQLATHAQAKGIDSDALLLDKEQLDKPFCRMPEGPPPTAPLGTAVGTGKVPPLEVIGAPSDSKHLKKKKVKILRKGK